MPVRTPISRRALDYRRALQIVAQGIVEQVARCEALEQDEELSQ